MADDRDILDLEEAYRAINNPSAEGHNLELAQWITGVSRRVDDLFGPVVQHTITGELHDGGGRRIFLDHAPAASITTITEYAATAGTTLTAETNASKPAAGYLLETIGGVSMVWRRSGGSDLCFPAGRRNVEVTYVAGRYANTATVDAKFKLAVGGVLRRLWARDAGAWARGSDPFDQTTPAFFDAFRQSIAEFLADEPRAPVIA